MLDLLALLLLILPVDVPPAWRPAVMPGLRRVAVALEVLDPREARYVLTRPEDLASDLHLLRVRLRDLRDAPPLSDYHRFPDRETISEALVFNRYYKQHLDALETVERVHWWQLHEAGEETDRLWQVYDTMRDACSDYYYLTIRREALQRLRDTLGPSVYYGAEPLPPPVPLWRFRRAD